MDQTESTSRVPLTASKGVVPGIGVWGWELAITNGKSSTRGRSFVTTRFWDTKWCVCFMSNRCSVQVQSESSMSPVHFCWAQMKLCDQSKYSPSQSVISSSTVQLVQVWLRLCAQSKCSPSQICAQSEYMFFCIRHRLQCEYSNKTYNLVVCVCGCFVCTFVLFCFLFVLCLQNNKTTNNLQNKTPWDHS